MTETYHAVVWIDHREAKIFHFDRDSADKLVVRPDHPSRHLHHKAHSIGSGKSPTDPDFWADVIRGIGESEAILIAGPGTAKTELVKFIAKTAPGLMAKVVAIETVDHPSDKELVAHARARFSSDHETLPRVS